MFTEIYIARTSRAFAGAVAGRVWDRMCVVLTSAKRACYLRLVVGLDPFSERLLQLSCAQLCSPSPCIHI